MQDAELLESLALEKLNQAVESIKGEGYARMRRQRGSAVAISA